MVAYSFTRNEGPSQMCKIALISLPRPESIAPTGTTVIMKVLQTDEPAKSKLDRFKELYGECRVYRDGNCHVVALSMEVTSRGEIREHGSQLFDDVRECFRPELISIQ